MEIGNFLKYKKSENKIDLARNSAMESHKFSDNTMKKQNNNNSNFYTINSSIMVNPFVEKNSKTNLRIPITQLEKFKMLTKSTKSNKFSNNQQNLNNESTIKPSSSISNNFPNLNKNPPIQNYNKNSTNKDLFLTQSSKFFGYNEEKSSSKKISLYKNLHKISTEYILQRLYRKTKI